MKKTQSNIIKVLLFLSIFIFMTTISSFGKNRYESHVENVYTFASEYKIAKESQVLENDIYSQEELKSAYISYVKDTIPKNIRIARYFFTLIISIIATRILLRKIYPMIVKKRMQMLIKRRMKNNEYTLYYQPIVNPKNDGVVGFEALLRLIDSKRGVLNPARFIKEIEDNDMIFDLSLWVLEKVIMDYEHINKNSSLSNKKLYISVNVSLREIENEEFVIKVKELLQKYKIEEHTICLEIIEKVGIKDLDKIQSSIKDLRNLGFMIAIDDFGVEYSNLSTLKKFDFDIIKLDKYFMDDIFEDDIKKEVMTFISNICTLTNKSLVAEGVEDQHQKDMIKQIENQKIYIQGYFYSKPLPIEQIKYIVFK